MKQRELEDLKNKFLAGDLSDAEEKEFISERRYLLADEDALSLYIEAMISEHKPEFIPMVKGDFLKTEKIRKKRTIRKKLIVAASISALLGLTYISYSNYENQKRKVAKQEEIEKAIITTRMALHSFSKNLNNNLNSINKGIDFSLPINAMKQLKLNNYETQNNTHLNTVDQL